MTSSNISSLTTLRRRELSDGWSLRATAGPAPAAIPESGLPAVVPGVVHTDLLASGLIPDPYLDDNEAALAWIGLVDWSYRARIAATPEELAAERLELVFEGLDTVATVTLDGDVIAEVADQHRTYRIDVTGRVSAEGNTLEVAFRSPVREANARSVALGARPRPYPLPYEALRKSACNFGWDWGIATFTSGIWRPVHLEAWSVARLDQVLVSAAPEDEGGIIVARITTARVADVELTVELEAAGAVVVAAIPAGATGTTVELHLPEVERWWPVGHGAQPLYDVKVRLLDGGEVLDETARRVGFRTVRWDTAPDADGIPFQLLVNERPVWVKGVNWIPDDALFPRVDRARYERRLRQAVSANLNLIRVWGGGIYESDDFYELCDELGLLTWQDFLFACAAYPEDAPLWAEVEAEARDNVARIGHHASLVLFTGNNENLWGFEDWGWKERLEGRSWGAGYYYELLPAVVQELAPHVPYAPGSPFSPGEGLHPNDESAGTMHLWEQWNRLGWETYREHTPRFVAEFGWQGPPTWSTLTRAISDDPLTPESPGMIVHQKALDGNVKLETGLRPHYRVPGDFENWHWAMQLNQANAVGAALDHFRSWAPHTSGAVVWQLNDCWPVTSWAAIDGDGREKPLLHALRNAFAPRVVTIQPRDGELVAVVGNDTREEWFGDLVISRRGFDGSTIEIDTVPVSVPAWSSATVSLPSTVQAPTDAASELLVIALGEVRGLWFFAEPRDSALPVPRFEVRTTSDDGVVLVTVTAETLLRDVTLLVDKVDPRASVDSGLVTLLPGESHEFRVRGSSRSDAALFADSRVLRSGNQLVTL